MRNGWQSRAPGYGDLLPWDRQQLEAPLMEADGGRREKPGIRMPTRLQRHGEAFCWVDPDTLAQSPSPPAEIQAQLEEVLGYCLRDPGGQERIKLRLHPLLKRWGLYERAYIPSLGTNLWKCFWICYEEPKHKDYLPADLDDLYLAHMAGMIGDYRLPTKQDFELIRRCDVKRFGVDAVNEFVGQKEDQAYLEAESREMDRTAAFLDDNWFLAHDEANQAAGSGQKMRSSACMGWAYKANVERYRRVDCGGYVRIEKKSRAEWEKEVAEALLRVKTFDKVEAAVLEDLRAELATKTDEDLEKFTGLTEEQIRAHIRYKEAQRKRLAAELGVQARFVKLGKTL